MVKYHILRVLWYIAYIQHSIIFLQGRTENFSRKFWGKPCAGFDYDGLPFEVFKLAYACLEGVEVFFQVLYGKGATYIIKMYQRTRKLHFRNFDWVTLHIYQKGKYSLRCMRTYVWGHIHEDELNILDYYLRQQHIQQQLAYLVAFSVYFLTISRN